MSDQYQNEIFGSQLDSKKNLLYQSCLDKGLCVWLTGLCCSGKTTIAGELAATLRELGGYITLLDGDTFRAHVSKDLGYSKEDRTLNIIRLGRVASGIVNHGGIVICAAITPYQELRDRVRDMVGFDKFVLVFVDTPINICEERDVKGLYARARRGEIKAFTGIDDPYEPPLDPDIILDTVDESPTQNVRQIVDWLARHGQIVGTTK